MSNNNIETYNPDKFGGKKEVAMMADFQLQRDDARSYFVSFIKPRLDRAYKLYISYNGDRASELRRLGKSWMANIFVPYTHAAIETLMPRILDARPEFNVQGRTEEDQVKSEKLQQLTDYTWEISGMDDTSETTARSSLIYGMGYLQVSYKKDVREFEYLQDKDITKKGKQVWKKEKKVYYDAPYCESVDNYALWYDWHNIPAASKQYWFKRLLLSDDDVERKYPYADKKRLKVALAASANDLTDFASIRREVKATHDTINKGDETRHQAGGVGTDIYSNQTDEKLKLNEVFEWWRPLKDRYCVTVNDVPILRKGDMPNPYDFKESPFIGIPFLKLPYEYEGVGLPLILESPQIMLNTMKNQRLDAVTLNIHKMWVVNPMANVTKEDLVVRPFGIIYSSDPNGVKEIAFSDVKVSAYKEEEMLKGDMRYASGIDDFSMAVGGGAGSATEIRHLRESTLERVRLFVNHMGSGYATMMRYWISLYRQFFTEDMTIRILGEDGKELFPLIEEDDLMGEFDYKAAVLPSIAGKNDIDKKQSMDLFQLLINLPFVDAEKLTSKVLHSWDWSLDSVVKKEEQTPMQPGMGMPGEQQPGMAGPGMGKPALEGGEIPQDVIDGALGMIGQGATPNSGFQEAGAPIDLLKTGGSLPPTVPGIKGGENPQGFNRGGKVNTNVPTREYPAEGNIANQAANIQS